jgi:hypothetical protein
MEIRRLLPLLVLVAGSTAAIAQRPSRSGIGYMGGPQVASWHSEAAAYRPVPGFVLGFYAPCWVGNRWELQPDLLLSLAGTSKNLPDGGRSKVSNLSAVMPVCLKVFLSPAFNIQAGVQGGYLLAARSGDQDISSQLNQLDMGMTVGAGIGTNEGLDITLRYYNGLRNTLVNDMALFPMNRTLQLTVGHRFIQYSSHRRRK